MSLFPYVHIFKCQGFYLSGACGWLRAILKIECPILLILHLHSTKLTMTLYQDEVFKGRSQLSMSETVNALLRD